jgi:hypothetical protein
MLESELMAAIAGGLMTGVAAWTIGDNATALIPIVAADIVALTRDNIAKSS